MKCIATYDPETGTSVFVPLPATTRYTAVVLNEDRSIKRVVVSTHIKQTAWEMLEKVEAPFPQRRVFDTDLGHWLKQPST